MDTGGKIENTRCWNIEKRFKSGGKRSLSVTQERKRDKAFMSAGLVKKASQRSRIPAGAEGRKGASWV